MPRLAWQAALKKTKVKLELLTDIDVPLMVENGIRDVFHWYAKTNNKYMKNFDIIIIVGEYLYRIKVSVYVQV